MRHVELKHEFVNFLPDEPAEGVVYVAMELAQVLHRCCCGCASKVVSALGPSQWKLEFDGQAISLNPAIDNWTLACRSHYRIKRNRVRWLARWSVVDCEVGA